jgi:phosphatidylserine/phosphatidylglycerophosphate/cardiolipin synthase-like enzyme
MTARDLSYVADLIEGGRLTWPFDIGQLLSIAPRNAHDELVRMMTDAASIDVSPRGFVWLLREVAAERAAREALGARVQAVISGPSFVPGLRDTDGAFREIITEANYSILITGFALHNGATILAALAARMDREPDLSVVLCLDIARPHGDTSDEQAIISRFAHRFRSNEWPAKRFPKLYYDHRSLSHDAGTRSSLHAKVAVADSSRVLIGSANLTEAAISRNVEIGVLISLPEVASRIRKHIETLIRERILIELPL